MRQDIHGATLFLSSTPLQSQTATCGVSLAKSVPQESSTAPLEYVDLVTQTDLRCIAVQRSAVCRNRSLPLREPIPQSLQHTCSH